MSYELAYTESAALILDQPFGADLAYPTSGSINLGGTGVVINNNDLTGIIRFAVPESGFGVHAGLRGARTDGRVTLGGDANYALNLSGTGLFQLAPAGAQSGATGGCTLRSVEPGHLVATVDGLDPHEGITVTARRGRSEPASRCSRWAC